MNIKYSLQLIMLIFLLNPLSSAADIYIIANKDNSINSLNDDQIERLFLRKTKRFENDVAAEPFAQPEGSKAREGFNKVVLKRTEQQLKYYWSRKLFTGGEPPPKMLNTEAEIIQAIEQQKGGIGYVKDISGASDKVKVIKQFKE